MLHTCLPVGVRMNKTELVLSAMMMRTSAVMSVSLVLVRNSVSMKTWGSHYKFSAGSVKSNRVKRCSNAKVRNDGGIIMITAVAVRRHIHYEADME